MLSMCNTQISLRLLLTAAIAEIEQKKQEASDSDCVRAYMTFT